MTDLPALLTHLQAATGADRELDGLLAVQFGGAKTKDFYGRDFTQVVRKFGSETFTSVQWDSWKVPCFTASIDAALGLIERVLPGWTWSAHPHHEGGMTMGVHPGPGIASVNGPWEKWGTAKTPALALCCALVQALIEKEGV